MCCELAPVLGDLAGNVERAAAAISTAVAAGADVVVLPELATSGYPFTSTDQARALAVPADHPLFTRWEQAAAGRVVVAGFAELDDGVVRNSAVLLDGSGGRTVYRKTHLWDTEKLFFTPGDEPPPVVDTAAGRIGVMVCYDLEFPEWVRAVALAGADLLCAPVNWPLLPRPDGERPTEMVRALAGAGTNRMPIAVCDRAGVERGVDWIGASVITDADGYPMKVAQYGEPGSITADVDLEQARVKRFNDNNDVHGDRRVDLYRRTALLD